MRWLSSMFSGWNWARRARAAAVQHNQAKAGAGDPAAQFALGERYHDGLGVGRDYDQALMWFLRAADQGHAMARMNAGMMLFLGRGCEADRVEAVKLLVLATEGGEPRAQAALDKISQKIDAAIVHEGRRRAAAYKATSTSP